MLSKRIIPCLDVTAGRVVKGGLSNMADIEQLCAVTDEGIEAVICGRAIYSGDLDFAAAQERADELLDLNADQDEA